MAEPIYISFGMLNQVGPENHILLDGVQILMQRGNFEGAAGPFKKV